MPAPDTRPLALALSPHGHLYLVPDPDDDVAELVPSPAAARIESAFAAGHGHGLLHLGAAEVNASLPPVFAWWRELARGYVAALCAVPDLEAQREKVHVPPPDDELAALADAAPPMTGAEYLTPAALADLWGAMEAAFRAAIAGETGAVADWLQAQSPLWHLVGRVCFHLAENKADPARPFAFLATYTAKLSASARVQHVPLGRALTEYAGARNKNALLALLTPVQRAAEKSAVVRALVESGELFHPLAWSPAEAYRFLRDVPVFEESGVVARLPDWWNRKRPPRPQVEVRVGEKKRATLGLDAMLDFSAALTLDGEALTRDEVERILAATDGLALVRGKWVEVDRERLAQVLAHWKAVQKAAARGELSFAEGMRLLAGADELPGAAGATPVDAADAGWSRVVPGDWLRDVLAALRDPTRLGAADPGDALRTELRPYQRAGVRWLWYLHNLGLGGVLADDMGLGKTLQVLALLLVMKQRGVAGPSVLVVPASLVANWRAEAARFAPSLRLRVAHPSAGGADPTAAPAEPELAATDLVVTTYAMLARLPWLTARPWTLVVLDEAQAIKNPSARQTRAAKALRGRTRVALTGTPVENRLGDLWSLFDFSLPGLLGSAKAFSSFVKKLADRPHNPYEPLRNLVRPYILRRLKTDRAVIADLPDKTEVRAFCALTKVQAALYQDAVRELEARLDGLGEIERRGVVLAFLMRLKQVCNHPSQWLGDGAYRPADSGKFARLAEVCEVVAARQEKVLVFTQFREVTDPLARFLAGVFGRPGLVLHGGTPVAKRKPLVDAFQRDERVPFFVLSLKAGGTGLNLTAASHVVHFDRWWNPAVEQQATDRAFRIGQKRNVLVHKFVCRGTVEERIDALISEKEALAGEVLREGGEVALTELSDAELLRMVSLDIHAAMTEG